jgi:glycosyltransferase involved in cell wall biosynthesis
MILISVILCAHNPRADYLRRVLDGLKSQTLPKEQWEFLFIDNASQEPLAGTWDLSWHPKARHIREEELGLTSARLRGIKESIASVLIFVDDDNILCDDYLQQAVEISANQPYLGVWGGQVLPIFDVPPPDWIKNHQHLLACREFLGDRWSNIPTENESLPCGAGICVRRQVANAYLDRVIKSPVRKLLGRKGIYLNSSEDTDMAFTACDIGLGMGEFCSLKLWHLIPTSRLEEDYLVRIWEGMVYSSRVLFALRGVIFVKKGFIRRSYDWLKSWRLGRIQRRFFQAKLQGEERAWRTVQQLRKN